MAHPRLLGAGSKRKVRRTLSVAGSWRESSVHVCCVADSRSVVTSSSPSILKVAGREPLRDTVPVTVATSFGRASATAKRGGRRTSSHRHDSIPMLGRESTRAALRGRAISYFGSRGTLTDMVRSVGASAILRAAVNSSGPSPHPARVSTRLAATVIGTSGRLETFTKRPLQRSGNRQVPSAMSRRR